MSTAIHMSTSRAGRGTLKRVGGASRSRPKGRGTWFPPTLPSCSGHPAASHTHAGGDVDVVDERLTTLEGFTGLGRAACAALLKRAGGDVEAAINRHFSALSPPPRAKKKLEDNGARDFRGEEENDRSKSQRTLAQSGFAPVAPTPSSHALATAAAAPSADAPPLFRPPPLAPRRRGPLASCGERWRAVPNAPGFDRGQLDDGGDAGAGAAATPCAANDTSTRNHSAGVDSAGAGVGAPPAATATTTLTAPFLVTLRGRSVRGAARHLAARPPPDTRICLEREADNRADPRAIRGLLPEERRAGRGTDENERGGGVADGSSAASPSPPRFLGYLPRDVSYHLSPWIDAGVIGLSGLTPATTPWCRDSEIPSSKVGDGEGKEGGAEEGCGGRRGEGGDQGVEEEAETGDVSVYLIASITAGDDDAGTRLAAGAAAAWSAAATAAATAAEADAALGGSRVAELTRKRMWLAVDRVRRSNDGTLLTEDEIDALDTLRALDHAAQSLAVRLLQRKTGWIRTTSLVGRYREVPDAAVAVGTLSDAGLLERVERSVGRESAVDDDAVLWEWLGLLTREELDEVARACGTARRGRRVDVTAALMAASREDVLSAWLSAVRDGAGRESGAIRLAPEIVRAVSVVMFLTFLDFSLSNVQSLVFQEIGVVRFPRMRGDEENDVDDASEDGAVEVDATPPLFPSREALDEYTEAAELAGRVDAALESGEEAEALQLLAPVLAPFLRVGGADQNDDDVAVDGDGVFARFSARWINAQMATVGVGLLERRGRYEEATRVLLALLAGCAAPDRRGGWYIRAATNLGHLGRANAALRMCEAGLGDTWVRGGDRLGLQRRALRLAKRCKRWALAGTAWKSDAEWEAPLERVRGVALNENVPEKNRYRLPCVTRNVVPVTEQQQAQEVSVEELALAHYASPVGSVNR